MMVETMVETFLFISGLIVISEVVVMVGIDSGGVFIGSIGAFIGSDGI